MTLYALTGTPGTGKSSVSEELRTRGYDVVDGKRFIIEHGLMGELDEERDTHEVDLDLLNDALEPFRASGPRRGWSSWTATCRTSWTPMG